VQKKAVSVMFRVLSKTSVGIGDTAVCCGFFVSPTLALTVSHARGECATGESVDGLSLDGTRLAFTIRYDDGDNGTNRSTTGANLDFMVLSLLGEPRLEFFPITTLRSPTSLLGNKFVALLACGIAMGDEIRPFVSQSLTVTEATIKHAGTRHFVYGSTWDGDSGGCLFFNNEHEVIGLHLEGVNRAKELLEHADAHADITLLEAPIAGEKRSRTDDAIRTVSASVRDVIGTVTTGGLALFVGCDAVRAAIAKAERLDVEGGGGGGGGGGGVRCA
jgi:hypothetical protein